MCGIFAYIGKRNDAANIVLEGLKRLEYRGYDSWGIAVKNVKRFDIEKHVGKIGVAHTILPPSNFGIGHTRWATHGGVTDFNAHPHLDCTKTISIVHNGIVENNDVLKKKLIAKGHKFLSETDTEVISHLIEENKKNNSFEEAVTKSFKELDGLNAIVAADSETNEIIAAKNGSPLIVGKNNGEYYLASDASALIPHTRTLLFVEDDMLIVINKQLKVILLRDNKVVTAKFEKIDWEIEEAEIGPYKHFMIKEIHEQPRIIRNIAKSYEKEIKLLSEVIDKAQGTFFIGAGTAYHACLAGAYLFAKISNIHINTAPASEFNYLESFLTKKSLVIALSQSGETIDVIEPLNRAKQKGAKIAVLTNVLGSTIYRMSDFKMLLSAGPEKAVASTKAYIAKLTILLMLSFSMIGKIDRAKDLLLAAADEIDRLISDKSIEEIKALAKLLSNSEHVYTIGRGASYPTALEAALKIKEVSYIHTEGLAGGELKHGTIALIEKGTPVIVFAPNDETFEAIISNATEIKSRGGVIIGVGSENSAVFDHFIEVKDLSEASIIAQVVPAQLLAYYLTLEKKYDPDKPRNLAKSVTVK
ncbi:MAG: glutamine--fructose-6-phosphate aminotransferase [Candidatus Levybacteria bacterium RIFCSPHIGHO2_01_FULL_40_15b]|nr:MAG: glutamine--fructose-6-phosphate aminotransferase [Candidatus Levybacteria bacterium RIFCSPHIGHO2_01_FULL_40_15b]